MAKDQENQSFQEIQQQEQGDDDSASSSSSTVTDAMEEDASSSSSSSSGPLFQLSDLMSHLPIKRGLSSYYEGKSQSCTSFGSLKGIEDLAKKEKTPYKKRMKACRTQRHWLPRPTIAKKGSSRSMAGLAGRNLHLLATCNEPTIPIQKQLPI